MRSLSPIHHTPNKNVHQNITNTPNHQLSPQKSIERLRNTTTKSKSPINHPTNIKPHQRQLYKPPSNHIR